MLTHNYCAILRTRRNYIEQTQDTSTLHSDGLQVGGPELVTGKDKRLFLPPQYSGRFWGLTSIQKIKLDLILKISQPERNANHPTLSSVGMGIY
jgi:hypothetical protein